MTILSRTAFERLHQGGVDPSVFLLCTFYTPQQGLKTHRRPPPLTLIATVAKISERWNWKILKRMESVEESLLALSTPPENVQPAIGFEKELKRMRGRMETTKRAQMWKAAEDAEFWRGRGEEDKEEEEKDGGDGTRKDDDDNNNNNNNNNNAKKKKSSSRFSTPRPKSPARIFARTSNTWASNRRARSGRRLKPFSANV